MTAKMYYDNDADPSALSGQTVAIIGYGSQGHAHALNLHESGVDVVVGLQPGSKSRPLAEGAGLRGPGRRPRARLPENRLIARGNVAFPSSGTLCEQATFRPPGRKAPHPHLRGGRAIGPPYGTARG